MVTRKNTYAFFLLLKKVHRQMILLKIYIHLEKVGGFIRSSCSILVSRLSRLFSVKKYFMNFCERKYRYHLFLCAFSYFPQENVCALFPVKNRCTTMHWSVSWLVVTRAKIIQRHMHKIIASYWFINDFIIDPAYKWCVLIYICKSISLKEREAIQR